MRDAISPPLILLLNVIGHSIVVVTIDEPKDDLSKVISSEPGICHETQDRTLEVIL